MAQMCRSCRKHPAGYCRGGHWRTRRDHDLCPKCFRAAMDRNRQQDLKMRPYGRID